MTDYNIHSWYTPVPYYSYFCRIYLFAIAANSIPDICAPEQYWNQAFRVKLFLNLQSSSYSNIYFLSYLFISHIKQRRLRMMILSSPFIRQESLWNFRDGSTSDKYEYLMPRVFVSSVH